jgi:dTMP kinase
MLNSPPRMRGILITFEGIEGCGKSTQARLLADALRADGREVVALREPGSTPLGDTIRGILLDRESPPFCDLAEAYLFAASRAELVQSTIRPALDRGAVVICDRFVDSSLVYQGLARGLGLERVRAINREAVADCWPDCTFVLELPTGEGLARASSRAAPDRIEKEQLKFHDAVHEGFLSLARQEPARFQVVDGRPAPEQIFPAVRAHVAHRFFGGTP